MLRPFRRRLVIATAILLVLVCGVIGWRTSNARLLLIARSVHVGQTEREVDSLLGRWELRFNGDEGGWRKVYGSRPVRAFLDDVIQTRSLDWISVVDSDWPLTLRFDRDGRLIQIEQYGEIIEKTETSVADDADAN